MIVDWERIKTGKQTEGNSKQRPPFPLWFEKLLSASQAATNGKTIGGPLAEFCSRGNLILTMSHSTVPLLLDQAEASLVGDSITASINRHGALHATIKEYWFRSSLGYVEELSFWEFVDSQEICERSDLTSDSPLNRSEICPFSGVSFRIIIRKGTFQLWLHLMKSILFYYVD